MPLDTSNSLQSFLQFVSACPPVFPLFFCLPHLQSRCPQIRCIIMQAPCFIFVYVCVPHPSLSYSPPVVPKQAFSFSLSVLDYIRVKEEGWSYLELTLKDYNKTALKNHSSQTHTLHFHQGGCQAFLDTLRRYVALIPYVYVQYSVVPQNRKAMLFHLTCPNADNLCSSSNVHHQMEV